MKLGTILSKGKVRPYDIVIVKKMRFDFKLIDIYDGIYRDWKEVMMYLESNAVIISKVTHDENSHKVRILLYEE